MRTIFYAVGLALASFTGVKAAYDASLFSPATLTALATSYANAAVSMCGTGTIAGAGLSSGVFTSANCTAASTWLQSSSTTSGSPYSICGNCVTNLNTLVSTLSAQSTCAPLASSLSGYLAYDTYNKDYCSNLMNSTWSATAAPYLVTVVVGQLNNPTNTDISIYPKLNASLGQCSGATLCAASTYGSYAAIITNSSTVGSTIGTQLATYLISSCPSLYNTVSNQVCGPAVVSSSNSSSNSTVTPSNPFSSENLANLTAAFFSAAVAKCGTSNLITYASTSKLTSSSNCTAALQTLLAVQSGTVTFSSVVPSKICGNCVSNLKQFISLATANANCASIGSYVGQILAYDTYNKDYCLTLMNSSWATDFTKTPAQKILAVVIGQVLNPSNTNLGIYTKLSGDECTGATLCAAYTYGSYAGLVANNTAYGDVVAAQLKTFLSTSCPAIAGSTANQVCGPEPAFSAPTKATPSPTKDSFAPSVNTLLSAILVSIVLLTKRAMQ